MHTHGSFTHAAQLKTPMRTHSHTHTLTHTLPGVQMLLGPFGVEHPIMRACPFPWRRTPYDFGTEICSDVRLNAVDSQRLSLPVSIIFLGLRRRARVFVFITSENN